MPGGRPTKYKPEYCEQLVEWGKQGLSFEAFAGEIDVCKETLYEWTRKHPEFLDAKKRHESKCRVWWEKIGNTQAAGKLQGNATSWIFNMKNRFKWRDRIETEGHNKVTVDVKYPDPRKAPIDEE